MITSCCVGVFSRVSDDDDVKPAPFTMRMQVCISSSFEGKCTLLIVQETKPGGGVFARLGSGGGSSSALTRSQGVTNLSLESESSEESDEIDVSHGGRRVTSPGSSHEPRRLTSAGDIIRTERLSSSASSSSSLSHNRSLPYYEVPTPTRVLPAQHRTQFGSFSPPAVVTTSPSGGSTHPNIV